VVEGVDLDLLPGEVLGLIGPNGGGKSTLLLMMAGLLKPSAGTVELGGIATRQLARQAAGRIGLLISEPGLYPLLTGWENLEYFGGLYGLSAAEVRRRATTLVGDLGLADAMDRPAETGSSGMRQKLSLCRSLLMQPRLLLLDEPTAHLDPVSARTILRVVRAHADGGLSVVLCTHDLAIAEALCERVAVLARTLLSVRTLPGPRHLPPVGSLFDPYRAALGELSPSDAVEGGA